MHDEARAGFAHMLGRTGLDTTTAWRVLDVGGANINGTVHDLLPNAAWMVMDAVDGQGVDLVGDAAEWIPGGPSFDVVTATELFEHAERWPEIIANMAAVLDPCGPQVLIATCASLRRPAHGAWGGERPGRGEWYRNVPVGELATALRHHFHTVAVEYQYPPGDAYAYAALLRAGS